MSISLDGFAVLERIGAGKELFAPIKADVVKAARSLVEKRLKAKDVTLVSFLEIRTALGAPAFAHVIDGMPAKSLASLAKKLDGQACEDPLKRLHDLANGVAEPLEPAPKKKKAAVKKTAKKDELLPGEVEFSSMYVVRKKRERAKAGA